MKTSDLKSLKVKFNEIPQGGLEYHFTRNGHELDQALSDLTSPDDDYDVTLSLSLIENLAQLKGHIQGDLLLVCSRCAEDFKSTYDKKFSLIFYKSEEAVESIAGSEVSEVESDFDLESLNGNEIDLGEKVHEQIALEVPFQPLCAETCLGLCTQCGTNLNLNPEHGHSEKLSMSSSPFAKLKELRRGD